MNRKRNAKSRICFELLQGGFFFLAFRCDGLNRQSDKTRAKTNLSLGFCLVKSSLKKRGKVENRTCILSLGKPPFVCPQPLLRGDSAVCALRRRHREVQNLSPPLTGATSWAFLFQDKAISFPSSAGICGNASLEAVGDNKCWEPPGAGSAGPAEIRPCGNPILPPSPGRGWGCSEGASMELLSWRLGGIPG